MPNPSTGENLLFAILAYKADFITAGHLVAALKSWGRDQARPMAQILRDLGGLTDKKENAVQGLVQIHLETHGNDAVASMRGLSPGGPLGIELPPLADHRLDQCVRHLIPAASPPSLPPAGTAPTAPGPRFLKVREHARGGLGKVFLAHDTELHREVALKEIRDDANPDHGDTRARFLREGEITGRLEHPGIVPVYSLGRDATGRPFYAMRFIRGESLADTIRRFHAPGAGRDPGQQGLELRRLLDRFLAACNAVAYAHSRGVLHRDLKPDNIMLGSFGETLVVDWGLARAADTPDETRSAEGTLALLEGRDFPSTETGKVIGTPQYMPPEQAKGRLDELSPASDVYSLGATLYQILTGRPPFRHPSEVGLEKVLQSVEDGTFPHPSEVNPAVPAPLEAVCLKAMARQPRDRYASAGELIQAVENWLLGREQAKAQALAQVEALREAAPQAVPLLLKELHPCREDVESRLRELWALSDLPDRQRLRVGLALLPIDAAAVRERLVEFLLQADDPQEVVLLRDGLGPFSAGLGQDLWRSLDDPAADPGRRFRALVALAAFDSDTPAWPRVAGQAVEQLLVANPLHVGIWKLALEPVRRALLGPLGDAFRAGKGTDQGRLAATILADYASDRPEVLAALAADADERQHAVLLPRLREQRERVTPALREELARSAPAGAADTGHDALALRQATAAVTLLRLGHEDSVWPLLRHSEDPGRRSYLLRHLASYGVEVQTILRRLEVEADVSARRALVLSLGEYTAGQLPADRRQPVTTRLLRWYRDDPDPGIHGAVDWLLRHGREGAAPRQLDWQQAEALQAIDARLAGQEAVGTRRWYVNKQGQTLTVFPGPVEFLMGSPGSEPGRGEDEELHRRRIGRSFALATKSVTVEQFQKFLKVHPEVGHSYNRRYSPDPDGPIIMETWYEAAQYCRWLSEQEEVPEDHMCYPPVEVIEKSKDARTPLRLPADYLSRTGYRLPTEAEWEYACRAGAHTSRFYGGDEGLLARYAWCIHNSQDRTWPVGQKRPNDCGLFDMHGNVWTWCQEGYSAYQPGPGGRPTEDEEDERDITYTLSRVLRGGSFSHVPSVARSAIRIKYPPANRYYGFGLRLARTCH
jgi:serine/threonine protein kinase/formylglycine-generating enzyme required for sulfatase activity